MQQDELDVLIDKTATLMAQYERRGAHIDARLQKLAETLHDVTDRLPETIRGSTDALLETVPAQVTGAVSAGLDRPLDAYREQLHRAGSDIEAAASALAGQIDGLRRLHRLLIWKAIGGAVLALALLIGGGAWLSVHYANVVRDNRLAADLMQAYNGSDVVLCGHRELCANVDTKRARYGERGQYLPVKPR